MRTVLVADDDAAFRELVCEVLTAGGYRVVTAEDGRAAWEALEREGADLAVLDLNMPRLDGLGLTFAIRADPRFSAMPILMLTIRELVNDQVSGYEHGADDYMTKPFDNAMLLARVRALERRIIGPGP